MSETAIQIRQLVKDYGSFRALQGIDLEVHAGEFFGLLGPNGAGKTTTINILSGLTNRSPGEVKIFGHDIRKDFRACRRSVGLVPQEFNFDQFAPCQKMLRFQGGFFGMSRADTKARSIELLKEFDLYEKRDAQARMLSGGMKRRLIIARALMHRPRLLILDEPTAGVDVDLRRSLWQYLRRLNGEGTTILLTTHYIEEAELLCDNIGIINHGRIIAQDTTANMVEQLQYEVVVITTSEAVVESQLDQLQDFQPKLNGQGRQLTLCFDKGSISYQDMLNRVIETGITVSSIKPADNRLEQVFVQLTKGEPS